MTKFKRKKQDNAEAIAEVTRTVSAPSTAHSDDSLDIEDLVGAAKEHIKGVFVPRDENEPLLQVTDWIAMPDPIRSVMGTPGIPCGLITEVYGKKDCLDGDTPISYWVTDESGKIQNAKGGTLRRLYERFNKIERTGKGYYQRQQTADSQFYIMSADQDGVLHRNRVTDVVRKGDRECVTLTTRNGSTLTLTKDHEVFSRGHYVRVFELKPGDTVGVHAKTPLVSGRTSPYRREILVKYHPKASTKINEGLTYYRLYEYRAVIEAHLNGMELSEYREALNRLDPSEIDKFQTIPDGVSVHHINEDPTDNRLENLMLVSESEHKSEHAKDSLGKYVVTEDEIVSIEPAGVREVFDVVCADPYRNFVANGIVIHNCGKTTFATEALINTQRDGGIAILIDTENKYSLKRAAAMGLDVRKLIIIKAKTIEEVFDKFIAMVTLIKNKKEYVNKKTGECASEKEFQDLKPAQKKEFKEQLKYAHRKVCAVWDSLGATPSEWEMDDTKTDFAMAAAKVIKGRLRKTLYYIKDTKTAFVVINQVYANTNSFGKKSTPYGGSGPEYHCAVILEFAALGRIRPAGVKSGTDFAGIKTKIEAVKNHLGQPFKTTEVEIDWRGFVVNRDAEYAPKGFFEDEKEKEEDETSGSSAGAAVATDEGGDSKPVRGAKKKRSAPVAEV